MPLKTDYTALMHNQFGVRELPRQFVRQELNPLNTSNLESNLDIHLSRLYELHPHLRVDFPMDLISINGIQKMQLLKEINETLGIRDLRNVIDVYKYWTDEAIRTNLDEKRHNFSVLVSNEFNDFNLGSVIRNSNAFLAKEVIIFGRKKYDKRGTVGTHFYENFKFVRTIEELVLPSDSIVVGIDNIDQSVPIETWEWPQDCHVIMVFGQEQIGLSDELKAICHHFVYIKQYGSVRSLNVGVASGIAMFSYCQKTVT